MRLADLVEASERVAGTAARTGKVVLVADALRRLDPDEIALGASYLAGELPQRQTGVGWASLQGLPVPAPEPTLTLADVDRAMARAEASSGSGSGAERDTIVRDLFAVATGPEQAFLRRLIAGELRQGAAAGVLADAIAAAAGIPADLVRRAAMLAGSLPDVARVALVDGAGAVAAIGLQVGRPVLPMLAGSAVDLASALSRSGPASVEWKLDGARIQVHRDGLDVAIFTRSLDDVTARLPEVVEAALALPARALILDGEAIALDPDGRPRPFQETASRFARGGAGDLTPVLFDVLHLDGSDLLDLPGRERRAALETVAGPLAVPRVVASVSGDAAAFQADAIARGHEGVMVKALDAPYEAGRRGAGWLKVKPVHTLDLVVLAAEWGHGRRTGSLSNLHLGARDPATGGFVMLGKTFKGLTDALLAFQTGALLAIATEQTPHVVHVRPELVVEVAFDGVQRSSRYPGGVTLRFARIRRYRDDKAAAEADTVETVRSFLG